MTDARRLPDAGMTRSTIPDRRRSAARCSRTRTFGRVGVTSGGLPVILPVRYLYADGAITFRTGGGTKLRAAESGDVLAFQVDAYDAETSGAGACSSSDGRPSDDRARARRAADDRPAARRRGRAITTCASTASWSPAGASCRCRRARPYPAARLTEGAQQRGERFAEVGEQRAAREAQGAVVEHGVGGAGRGPGRVEIGGRDRLDAGRVVARGAQHLARELVPAHRALVRDVPGARAAARRRTCAASHARSARRSGSPRWSSTKRSGVVAGREPQHRLRHVRAVAPDRPTTCARPRTRGRPRTRRRASTARTPSRVRACPTRGTARVACRRTRSRSRA